MTPDERLDEIVTAYLKAAEAGAAPDPAEWIARHPEFADELREFFAAQARVERLAAPLREASPDETAALDVAQPALPTLRYFGDYELLEEIARGGMGVVYRARQVSLNRVVAVKMILAGRLASARDVERFRREAEAAANLDHPNIVPVHEVGEHEGQHYFAMKLLDGGSLAGRRFPPAEAARLVATVARAVHHAHQRGILHRDLKPSNILLDAAGRPHVGDFGLARSLDASGVTASGGVVGTPAYMAPEQARGDKAPTVAADVWGLGAVLYELLTGRSPFARPTSVETLLAVLHDEPEPPSKTLPGLSADLETVCLKCLCKEPAARYASAAELADDLERYLAGEPVQARPVGRLGRAWRWCRRNPALALVSAAAVLCLVVGAAVSAWFAVEARRQASEVRRVNEDLRTERDALEGTLARTWLSPLASTPGPLTEPEVAALREVSLQRGKPLALRFLREATTDPAFRPKLGARAEYVLHAALGLDRRHRAEAERMLLEGLRRAPQDEPPVDVALAAVALGGLSPETADRTAAALAAALDRKTDAVAVPRLARGLAALADRLDSPAAARAVATLTAALPREWPPGAAGLETERVLLDALRILVGRVEPEDRVLSATAVTLARLLLGAADDTVLSGYVETKAGMVLPTLTAVGGRLGPGAAAEAEAVLLPVLPIAELGWTAVRGYRVGYAQQGLAALGAGPALTEALGKAADLGSLMALARTFPVVAGGMQPEAAARAAAVLAEAMARLDGSKPQDQLTLDVLATALAAVAGRMAAPEAAAVCSRAVPRLTEAMQKNTTRPDLLMSLAKAVGKLAGRLPAHEAAEVCTRATALIAGQPEMAGPFTAPGGPDSALAQALVALGEPLDSRAAAAMARTLTRALCQSKDRGSALALVHGLSGLASRLEAREATALSAQLTEALSRADTPVAVLRPLVNALLALTDRLEPEDRPAVFGTAADSLARALRGAMDPSAVVDLAYALDALAPRLEPRPAGVAAAAVTEAFARTTDPAALTNLAAALRALAPRMEARAANRACTAAIDVLSRALDRTTDFATRTYLAHAVATLAAWLEPADASRVCAHAIDAILPVVGPASGPLPDSFPGMVEHLTPADAAVLAGRLVDALRRKPAPPHTPVLTQAFVLVAGRLEPGAAVEPARAVAAILTEALDGSRDRDVQSSLVRGLAAVAAYLPPRDAAGVAATLGRALDRTTDELGLLYLSQALVAVNARLDPPDTRGVVAILVQVMNRTDNSHVRSEMARLVAEWVAQLPPDEGAAVCSRAITRITEDLSKNPDRTASPAGMATLVHRQPARRVRVVAVAGMLAGLSDGSVLSAAAVLRPTFVETLAPPWPAQVLVDLLKDPFCVGEPRRLVLGQLSRHYGRPFADQWDFARFAEEHAPGLDLRGGGR